MSGRGRVFYAGAAFESPRPALAGSMMMLTKRLMRVATAIAISSPTLRALPGAPGGAAGFLVSQDARALASNGTVVGVRGRGRGFAGHGGWTQSVLVFCSKV